MAGVVLAERMPDLAVVTAGTHVIEHQPMSIRTRAALHAVGLPVPAHRSHQITVGDAERATLVLAMAAEHVRFVRRHHPTASARTATLRWLVDHLEPGTGSLADRLAALDLAAVPLEDQADVEDPAGGDEACYTACARELVELVTALVPRLL